VLRVVTTDLILISNAPNAASWIPGVTVAADVRPERGSLVALHTALTRANDRVLVVAWDMPFVTVELLRALQRRLSPDSFAAVPHGRHGPEPFCAAYAPTCLPFLDAALDAGELQVSAWLARLPVVDRLSIEEVSRFGDPDRLFFNVNAPADLATAERMNENDNDGRAHSRRDSPSQ
jgi:molybdopterin-guanine dinucleotide biosynthesis protein A